VPSAPSVRRAVALLTIAAGGAGAQPPAALVPPDDPTYALLDELGALVPLPGAIVGQRPSSRREIVRLARAACAVLARDSAGISGATTAPPARQRAAQLVAAVLDAHERRDLAAEAPPINEGLGDPCRDSVLRPSRLATRLEALAISAVGSSVEPRPVPRDNGIGSIAAVSNPALDARGGRPIVQGGALSLESVHTLAVGGWLALVAQPRVSLVTSPDGGTRWEAVPQRLSGRVVWRNVALGAGLEPRQWGFGGARSLFLSNNALPLPAVSLASDTAFRLPWLLRGLGRVRAELLVADLGRGREFPHAKLAAYKLDLAPTSWLEVGAGLMSQMGGRGAPALDLEGRVRDLAPFVFWLVDEGSDPIATNKVANAQLRVRIPRLRSASLAWELAVDDFDLRRVRRMLWEDTGTPRGPHAAAPDERRLGRPRCAVAPHVAAPLPALPVHRRPDVPRPHPRQPARTRDHRRLRHRHLAPRGPHDLAPAARPRGARLQPVDLARRERRGGRLRLRARRGRRREGEPQSRVDRGPPGDARRGSRVVRARWPGARAAPRLRARPVGGAAAVRGGRGGGEVLSERGALGAQR
jgi:hypothetical protein